MKKNHEEELVGDAMMQGAMMGSGMAYESCSKDGWGH
jgi:hypothetical protein